MWGWGIADYPQLLPGLTVTQGAAATGTLTTTLSVTVGGSILLIPSMLLLFALFQHDQPDTQPQSRAARDHNDT